MLSELACDLYYQIVILPQSSHTVVQTFHLIIDQFISITITAHYGSILSPRVLLSIFHIAFNHASHNFMHSVNCINCNIIENLINKVIDVKPLVPFFITEYANSLTSHTSMHENKISWYRSD